ncbi:hypothetical protein KJ765_00475 [Candidatus Micrarchaeota archaeon]|nr:hypothetical protein [Candidatus Micrarchaeota archaeon]
MPRIEFRPLRKEHLVDAVRLSLRAFKEDRTLGGLPTYRDLKTPIESVRSLRSELNHMAEHPRSNVIGSFVQPRRGTETLAGISYSTPLPFWLKENPDHLLPFEPTLLDEIRKHSPGIRAEHVAFIGGLAVHPDFQKSASQRLRLGTRHVEQQEAFVREHFSAAVVFILEGAKSMRMVRKDPAWIFLESPTTHSSGPNGYWAYKVFKPRNGSRS